MGRDIGIIIANTVYNSNISAYFDDWEGAWYDLLHLAINCCRSAFKGIIEGYYDMFG